MQKLFLLIFIVLFGSASFTVQAQNPTVNPASPATTVDSGIKANLALGEVTAINSTDNKISLQTKDGGIDVVIASTSVFKKVPPENPKLSAATNSSISDIGVGDRILVTGLVASDKKSIPAKTVYLMSKADITKKNISEQEAWKTRGVSGRVISVNPTTEELTVAMRGLAGEQNIVIKPKGKVNYRRYAPDSVKFDDAKTSSFSEIKTGDQIRALGDRSADNTSFQAERVVSGSFKMVGGTITAIDTVKNEITVKELQTNKPVTIVVNNSSTLRTFPVEMATMMVLRMQSGGIQPPQGGQGGNVMIRPPQGSQPTGQMQTTGGVTRGGGMRDGRGDFDDLLERLPKISLTDLKVGDAIGVSSSSTGDTNRYTAIKLVSGVEPFFKAPQTTTGGGQPSNQPQINIPGLNGF